MDLDLLVIGDSSAGWQGAVTAAQLGHKVGLIALSAGAAAWQADLRQIPGEVLSDACADWPLSGRVEPTGSRPAGHVQWIRFAAYVKATWQHEIDLYRGQLLAAGGQVWAGSPVLTSTQSVTVASSESTSQELQAPQMLIAIGTEPRRPRFANVELPNVFDAARMLDVVALPQEACVVGAGVTGLRAACLLAWWGVKVRVIDGWSRDSLLHDEEISAQFSQAAELGVSFECGEDVIGLMAGAGRRVVITLESGHHLETQSVFLATGRQGRTDELQLENAELTSDDCGRLWCGAELRTWTESISAVGDVVGYTPEIGSERELVNLAVQALLAPVLV